MFITLFFLYPLLVNAANDWSTPCRGSCSYEIGNDNTTAWGSILLDGATETISDISTAAGWSIMDCNSTSTDTEVIRIVCHDPDAGCDHLFEGGAEQTIVRLPEECTDAPFARVVNVTSSDNQTLTSTVAKRMTASSRRRSTPPEVLTMTIDYKFSLIPTTRGNVSMTALATTNPLQRPATNTQALRRALGYSESGELNARSATSTGGSVDPEMLQRDLFADFLGGNKIPAGTTWGEANSTGPSKRDLESRLFHWSDDWNEQYQVLNIQENFNVIDDSISCPNSNNGAYNADMRVDVYVDARATLAVGLVLAGSVIPPKITRAAFTTALDGGIHTEYTMSSNVYGSLNTGVKTLFSVELPGVGIRGILEFGPTFSINTQAGGHFNVIVEATAVHNYDFPGISSVFPPEEGPSSAQASPNAAQNPLTLSIADADSLQAHVAIHILPRVSLGITILDGLATASVFLEIDGFGELDLNFEFDRQISTGVGGPTTTVTTTTSTSTFINTTSTASEIQSVSFNFTSSTSNNEPVETSSPDNVVFAQGEPDYLDSYQVSLSSIAAPNATTSTTTTSAATGSCPAHRHRPRQQPQPPHRREHVQRDNTRSFSGCITLSAGVAIAVGLEGTFLWFRDDLTRDLWQDTWTLFYKCWNGYQPPAPPPPQPTTTDQIGIDRGGKKPFAKHKRQQLSADLICPLIDSLAPLQQMI